MRTITIDNAPYDLDQFSPEARAQLESIHFVDQELARLQAQTAALQTARAAYAHALRPLMPAPLAPAPAPATAQAKDQPPPAARRKAS